MKKKLSILLLLIIMCMCFGCSSMDKAAPEACDVNLEMVMDDSVYSMERSVDGSDMKPDGATGAEPAETAAAVSEPLVCVSFSESSWQSTDDDGEKLFVSRCYEPTFVTEDDAVNGWLKGLVDAAGTQTELDLLQVEKQAWQDRDNREEEGVSFYAYSYYANVSTERLDSAVISALQVNSVYSGGAHPGYAQIAYNLDLINRTELTLDDVILPGSDTKLQQGILDRLEQRFGGLEHSGLYADYPEIVKASFAVPGLTPNWYFSSTGLVIYYNCYDIAPYAAGIIKVEFPYDTLDGILRPEYFPKTVAAGEGSVALIQAVEGRSVLNDQQEGSGFCIGPEGSTVYDVKIYRITGWLTDDVPIQGPMVFAANRLTVSEAVILSDDSDAWYLLTHRNTEGQLEKLAVNSSEIREIVAEMAE